MPMWRNGRRGRLKIYSWQQGAGSSPVIGNSPNVLKETFGFFLYSKRRKMIIYIYGKCSTCKTALHYLMERGIAHTAKEITKEPPSIAELQQMLKYQNGNLKKLFNTSGMLYKEMGLKEKLEHLPIDKALELLNQNGMLVKRPFLLEDDFGLVGFNETEWSKKI